MLFLYSLSRVVVHFLLLFAFRLLVVPAALFLRVTVNFVGF